MRQRKALGKPISILDGQIASIASVQGAKIATRNIRDFSDYGLSLFNPFENSMCVRINLSRKLF